MDANGVITAETLEPITTAVTSNIGVIPPVAISIFAIVLGITFIPKIIKMFRK